MSNAAKPQETVTIATNRRARHEYTIEDTLEAGLVLMGSEVKSLRAGRVSLGDGYVIDKNDELYLVNVHIHEYPQANRANHEPMRARKLLLHRRQINRVMDRVNQKGLSCIPMRLYFSSGIVKVELGLGKGKKLHDKRQNLKSRDAKREMDRSRNSD